jgi:hypothetical protein
MFLGAGRVVANLYLWALYTMFRDAEQEAFQENGK